MLKKTVETMEREMDSKIEDMERAHAIRDARETNVETNIIEVDTSDWQILRVANGGGAPPKRQKMAHGGDSV